jgi:hypothetical protein
VDCHVEIFLLPIFRHRADTSADKRIFLMSFLLLSTSYEWAQSCPQTAGLYLSAKCKMAEHSSYPKLLLRERKQELEHLDETRPNYESCRRSLEQAIQELTTLLGDRIEGEDI